MSSELQILLKRTQKPQPKYKEPSSEPSPALLSLLGRMEARSWKEETMAATIEYIRQTVWEIKFIRHLRICEQCQAETTIGVERYGGSRLPWFLNLCNDVNECYDPEDPRFKDCPRLEDYQFGSYWDRTTNFEEIMRFINDRISWAEKLNLQQIWVAVNYYKLLKRWDLNEPYPHEETLPF